MDILKVIHKLVNGDVKETNIKKELIGSYFENFLSRSKKQFVIVDEKGEHEIKSIEVILKE